MAKHVTNKDCFKKEPHEPHVWHDAFECSGMGLDEDGYVRNVSAALANGEAREMHYWAGAHIPVRKCRRIDEHLEHAWDWANNDHSVGERSYCPGVHVTEQEKTLLEKLSTPIYAPRRSGKNTVINELKESAPPVLDGRQAYGDRVQNMKDQAAMINAYLGGREVTAVDVPMFLVLIKAHRLGRMQDYADNYDDIDGYMQIAREVVGDDMIQAATAREYSEIKKRGDQSDGRTMDSFVRAAGFDPNERQKPRHPYENVQRDEDNDA
ncbi:hypothetical protein SEA_DUMPQUIST_6 [Microbacterium phage DumpQuist]|nr:hypothetical protein SEA_DUMPQUIST_6 [Microbacterium phage DumpQuist]